jgi:hypothetical protein
VRPSATHHSATEWMVDNRASKLLGCACEYSVDDCNDDAIPVATRQDSHAPTNSGSQRTAEQRKACQLLGMLVPDEHRHRLVHRAAFRPTATQPMKQESCVAPSLCNDSACAIKLTAHAPPHPPPTRNICKCVSSGRWCTASMHWPM